MLYKIDRGLKRLSFEELFTVGDDIQPLASFGRLSRELNQARFRSANG
jgi:hypothetical protein